MKRYFALLILVLISLILSACGTQNSNTATPSVTSSVSPAEITAAATYRRTLPPSFTPTFTPTATFTPTITPTFTQTAIPTLIPEAALCEEFVAAIVAPLSPTSTLLLVSIESTSVAIHFRLIYIDTDEILIDENLLGGNVYQLNFTTDVFYEGDYAWEASLVDEERSGMCLQSATFNIIEPEVTPELTPEMTVEATAEVTEEGD